MNNETNNTMNSNSYTRFLKSCHKFHEEYNKEVKDKLYDKFGDKFESDEDKQALDEFFAGLCTKPDIALKTCAPKKKRAPTAYNLFMKDMIMKLRQEHPTIDKKELMSMGAQEWQKQKQLKLNQNTKPPQTTSKSKGK